MGWLARSRASRLMTRLFVRAYGVDLDEAEGDLSDFSTLESLFTRRLKDGMRPIDSAEDAIVSPVDGRVAAVGRTVDQRIELAPGRFLSIASLLDEPVDGEQDVAVLYLSPKDYHRVHVPREGSAVRWTYLPGTLWPVFPAAVRRVDDLFSKNERFAVHMNTSRGPLAVVLVGAFGVGRISTVVCDLITNVGNTRTRIQDQPAEPIELARGADLGVFHLGSTVVLVAPPGAWTWTIAAGQSVRFGEGIGRATLVLQGPQS